MNSTAGEACSGAHRDALDGIIDEHFLHEVNAFGAQQREGGAQVLGRPLREQVPVLELSHARPHLLVGRTQQLEYMKQLLPLTVSWQQRHLSHP